MTSGGGLDGRLARTCQAPGTSVSRHPSSQADEASNFVRGFSARF